MLRARAAKVGRQQDHFDPKIHESVHDYDYTLYTCIYICYFVIFSWAVYTFGMLQHKRLKGWFPGCLMAIYHMSVSTLDKF